ncbi:MAG: Hsp70 family protein, partial [Deltaproteobacteria bacterium]|nr:Hsp70 family protein [Deltaproteobacteria bacterium]
MHRTTIDFGIDLGTTNSVVSLVKGTQIEVFKDDEGFEYTPSAVWIDKKNRLHVGRRAKERLETDSDNAYSEFKLQMGTKSEFMFARNGRRMKPEYLSAEVLKSLKAIVKKRTDEDIQAAVITVPAAFELPQCEATNKAGQLAGFATSPLLQEPVAAALAYGFQSESDKVFWLVYDFGGGTFDAAVIQVRDGVIQIVNHGGDNHLGGKLIDWEIVEQLLIPAVTKEYPLKDFRRGNPKWRDAMAKLKHQAETAKIRVANDDSAEISFDFLCQDDQGNPVAFDYELKKTEVERLAEPYILRSINICKKVLSEKHLVSGNIEKVLLVGGPTLMPCLRKRLAALNEGLGISLEFNVDPLTVVGCGAAIFAGTQRVEGIVPQPVSQGQYSIELEYKPVGTDTEPLIGGKVLASNGENFSGFTVEFVNLEAHPPWRSGKIEVAPDGFFVTNLRAEKGQNTFFIELCGTTGTKCETVPDRLTYTIGLTITDQPLIHSVGIALADNEVAIFFEKGKPLPARWREIRKTAFEVRQGQGGNLFKIPLVEGENKRADRNREIGSLVIPASQIKRDVPAGSEVEITIQIDQSRIVRTNAYIPILDEEYEEVIKYDYEPPSPEKLKKEIQCEKNRLDEARKKAQTIGDLKGQELLQRIDRERMEHELDASLAASRVEADAADKCDKRLLDLRLAVDELEEVLEWPALLAEAEEEIRVTKEVIQEHGNSGDKEKMKTLEKETRQAMEIRDADFLRRKIDQLSGLRIDVLREQ